MDSLKEGEHLAFKSNLQVNPNPHWHLRSLVHSRRIYHEKSNYYFYWLPCSSCRSSNNHARFGSSDSFVDGNDILAGEVFNKQDCLDFDMKLVDRCHWLYNSMVTGLGPEEFGWNPSVISMGQRVFYKKSGFISRTITKYYAWWSSIATIVRTKSHAMRCTVTRHVIRPWPWRRPAELAMAPLGSLTSNARWSKDEQQIFLFAEIFKYSTYDTEAGVQDSMPT